MKGERLSIQSPADGIRKGVALLPENRKDEGLVLGMSVAENTTMPIWRRIQKVGLLDRRELAVLPIHT